jgi:AcrR family transcriptional regulator
MFSPVKPDRKRLGAVERRRQIVRCASALIAEHGVDHVRMPEVAAAAGVTRVVVYRHFTSRKDIFAAVLADFEEELTRQFRARAGLLGGGAELVTAIHGFAEATCDAIDAAGPGGWILLHMDGPDSDTAELGRAALARINRPWRKRVAQYTGCDARTAAIVAEMAVATSRAVLALYIAKKVPREEALSTLARGEAGLLDAFRRGQTQKK